MSPTSGRGAPVVAGDRIDDHGVMTAPDPTRLAAERERLRAAHLVPADRRPATTARGLHHTALVSGDVERTIGFMFNLKKRLNGILAKHCGKTIEEVERDSDRDNYMTAEESVAYGLVDKVLESRKQLPDTVAALTETKKSDD